MFGQDYNDKVTYWGSPVVDGWGAKVFAEPKILKCRWEQNAERFVAYSGEQTVSNAVVFVPVNVDLGGYLFKGISESLDPLSVAGAFEIRQVHEIPDLRNMFKERRVML